MSKIIGAEDILNEAQGCVECIYMAASDLPRESRDPTQAVGDIASKKIGEAVALLNECLQSEDASPAPADAKPKSRPARAKRRST